MDNNNNNNNNNNKISRSEVVKAHRFEDEARLRVQLGLLLVLLLIHGMWEDGHRLPHLGKVRFLVAGSWMEMDLQLMLIRRLIIFDKNDSSW